MAARGIGAKSGLRSFGQNPPFAAHHWPPTPLKMANPKETHVICQADQFR